MQPVESAPFLAGQMMRSTVCDQLSESSRVFAGGKGKQSDETDMTENPDFGDFQVVGWTLGLGNPVRRPKNFPATLMVF